MQLNCIPSIQILYILDISATGQTLARATGRRKIQILLPPPPPSPVCHPGCQKALSSAAGTAFVAFSLNTSTAKESALVVEILCSEAVKLAPGVEVVGSVLG